MRKDEFPIVDAYVRKEVNAVLTNLKEDIGRYELNCRFADYSQGEECIACNKNVFGSIYRMIDKRMKE